MMDIPDAPWIRKLENDGEEPGPEYTCPICGKICDTIYTDENNDVAGCDWCVTSWDPEEWWCKYGQD